jgi:hypothetical protein
MNIVPITIEVKKPRPTPIHIRFRMDLTNSCSADEIDGMNLLSKPNKMDNIIVHSNVSLRTMKNAGTLNKFSKFMIYFHLKREKKLRDDFK